MFLTNYSISNNHSDSLTINEVNNVVNYIDSIQPPSRDVQISSVRDISDIIRKTEKKKATGIDVGEKFNNIINKHNKCLSSIPIPKIYKPPPDPMSYRPISLLSSVNTILEKIMQEWLVNFIDESNTLPAQQIGFRIKHNICQTLLKIRILVKNSCRHSISTGMVLLDIKAAFDSVWHDGFIYKLNIFVFPLPIIKMIRSFLHERSFKVYLGKKSIEEVHIVLKGHVYPRFFTIY